MVWGLARTPKPAKSTCSRTSYAYSAVPAPLLGLNSAIKTRIAESTVNAVMGRGPGVFKEGPSPIAGDPVSIDVQNFFKAAFLVNLLQRLFALFAASSRSHTGAVSAEHPLHVLPYWPVTLNSQYMVCTICRGTTAQRTSLQKDQARCSDRRLFRQPPCSLPYTFQRLLLLYCLWS